MKLLKSVTAMLLALCMLLPLSSCAMLANDGSSDNGDDVVNEGNNNSSGSNNSGDDGSADTDNSYVNSNIKGGVYTEDNGGVRYTNDDIGATVLFDGSWYVADMTELAGMINLTVDTSSGQSSSDIANLMRESNTFFDLYTLSSDSTRSINITYEKLNAIYGAILSEEGYIDASFDNLDASLVQSGFSDIVKSKTTQMFAGKEHAAIELEASLNGGKVYEKLVCIKSGSYMVCVTFATYNENNTDELVAMFTAK